MRRQEWLASRSVGHGACLAAVLRESRRHAHSCDRHATGARVYETRNGSEFLNIVAGEKSPLDWSLYHCVTRDWLDPSNPEWDELEQAHYCTYDVDIIDLGPRPAP